MRTRELAIVAAAVLTAGMAAAADLPAPPAAVDVTQTIRKAEVLAARHSWDAAIAAYREALAADPANPVLHNRLGICYQRSDNARLARKHYERALKLRKDYAEAENNLGTLDHAQRRYKKAIAHYANAIKMKPTDAVLFKNLGAAWLGRGDVEKALEAWNEALRLDPVVFAAESEGVPAGTVDLVQKYFLVAKLLAARGDVEKALEFLTRARELGFRDFAKVEGDPDFAGVVKDQRWVAMAH